MNWEFLKIYFPSGIVPTNEFGPISIEDLQNDESIEYITVNITECARHMLTNTQTYVWGRNGEHAVGQEYNVYGDTEHPDLTNCPLNVYGQSMINDWLYFNDL